MKKKILNVKDIKRKKRLKKLAQRRWYIKHRKEILEKSKQRTKKDIEHKKRYDKERRRRLSKQLKELWQKTYKNHPERFRRYHKHLWWNNRTREQRRNRLNYIKHRDRRMKAAKKMTVRFSLLKRIAKKRKFKCNISFNFYCKLFLKGCHYCGASLLEQFGYCLDRKDNNKGYIKGNVVPCCKACNWGRNRNFTYDEWMVMIKAVKRFRNKQKKEKKS